MNILLLRRLTLAFVVGTVTVLLPGCFLPGGGYGYDDGSIGVGYYEPYGGDYGGWGSGYHVAPFRGGDHRSTSGGGHASEHAYKSAPASHSTPSIPSQSRSGGGGHGGGGGSGRGAGKLGL